MKNVKPKLLEATKPVHHVSQNEISILPRSLSMKSKNPFVPDSPFIDASSSFSSHSSTFSQKKAQLYVEVEDEAPLNTGPQIPEIREPVQARTSKGKEKLKRDHPFVHMINPLPRVDTLKWYKEQENTYYQNGRWPLVKGQFKHEHGIVSMFQYAFQPKSAEEKEPSSDHKQKNFIGKFCDHLQQNIDDLCTNVIFLQEKLHFLSEWYLLRVSIYPFLVTNWDII